MQEISINRLKIVFICGSLEPGKDGVGDYTRKLSGELIRFGHDASIIALYDKSAHIVEQEVQHDIHTKVPVLRIPIRFKDAKRFEFAKNYIELRNPEWLSLQFVPYSFQKKGLPFDLGSKLAKISKGKKWHIMVHELWIGREKSFTIKNKLLSFAQQIAIQKLFGKLNAWIIHTHLPEYYENLKKIKINSKELPLFSNIYNYEQESATKELNVFRIGFFSQINSSFAIKRFLNDMAEVLCNKNYKPEIWLIGGNKAKMNKIKNNFENELSGISNIFYTGFLDEKEISKVIKSCNLGLTPVPRHGLGKSGSVAAFISHGIPVAAPNIHFGYPSCKIGFFPKSLQNSIQIEPYWEDYLRAKKNIFEAIDEIRLTNIAKSFCDDVSNS